MRGLPTSTVIDHLHQQLIVSCQAYPGEPLRHADVMVRVAESVVRGGARAVRMEGEADVAGARDRTEAIIIGLRKVGTDSVFITPTLGDARLIAEAGAHIVAVDGTCAPRPDGRTLDEVISALKREFDVLVMADCGSVADIAHAAEAGADLIGTTLSGYTGDRPCGEGPDLELISAGVQVTDIPIVAEGRFTTVAHVEQGFLRGAHAICIGSAITHPESITRRFLKAAATFTGMP